MLCKVDSVAALAQATALSLLPLSESFSHSGLTLSFDRHGSQSDSFLALN